MAYSKSSQHKSECGFDDIYVRVSRSEGITGKMIRGA